MRRLGLLFVFVGFVWLASLQLISYMRVLARPIADAANAELAQMPVVSHPSPWKMEGLYGFVLCDSSPLPFTPWKGRLGFFNVPPEAFNP